MASSLSRLERLSRIKWLRIQIPHRPIFYSYFKESFSDEYHIYEHIPLHSYDYLNKSSIKINVTTDAGNRWNEMGHLTNDEILVALQSWLWVWVELMAW